ncbi:MAG: glycosyltransferase family 2 protein [Vicinamibacterales bacterium]
MASAPPRLTIGMPVFNGAPWIEAAVDSVLGQSIADLALIISDNASTDQTQAICERIAAADSRVRYVRNDTNIGVLRNYDQVFALSTTPYFKWASCSDVCLDGFLDKCLAVLEARPDVVLAYPRAIVILSPEDGRTKEYAQEYDDDLDLQQERPSERFREYLNRERINNVMNGVIRASALRQTALNRPLPGSDISMIAELTLRGKFVEIPDRLFVRRLNRETTGILMDRAASAATGHPGQPNNLQRLKLHSYRFLTTLRAPISFYEKLCVWLYLLRRVAWLRHRAFNKALRMARIRR